MSTPTDLAIAVDQKDIAQIRVLHAQRLLEVFDRLIVKDVVGLEEANVLATNSCSPKGSLLVEYDSFLEHLHVALPESSF